MSSSQDSAPTNQPSDGTSRAGLSGLLLGRVSHRFVDVELGSSPAYCAHHVAHGRFEPETPDRRVHDRDRLREHVDQRFPNTATSIMMLPIGMSVISLMTDENSPAVERYATRPLLAIAYPASIGGVATLIGTPPNAILFSTGRIRIQAMMRAGLALNVTCVVIATLVPYVIIGWLW